MALAVLIFLWNFTQTSTSINEPAVPATSSESPRISQTIEMFNAAKSAPLKLEGNYKVNWKTLDGDCHKTDVSLRAAWDTIHYGTVFNIDGYGSGESYFYDLENGNYYLEANGIFSDTCHWTATFIPIDLG
jgi:hypothetical protein